jgi:hypothetical protein
MLPPWPAPPDASFPTLWSLVVAYSRRKVSATTWRRRSSSVDRAALGRLPHAPKFGGGILEEEGERDDLKEEELLGRPLTVPPHLRALPCLALPLYWRKGEAALRRGAGGPWRRRKGGASSAGRHEREEARSENGCHRRVLHFCVTWEARLKMRKEDWYFVGDISVSYSAMLETHLTFFAVY